MRGVISAAMVLGLEQLGLLNAFDRVYGSSAGAINGAYFLAGQAAFGTTTYYENINNSRFINFWRPLLGRPVVDVDFAIWHAMTQEKPLDTSRVIACAIPLYVVATNADSGEREIISDWSNADDLLHALRASATMPIVAGQPYQHRGKRYYDALLAEPIPVPAAEDQGCTHILALLTRPEGNRALPLSWFERRMLAPRLRRGSPALADLYVTRPDRYAALLRCLDKGVGPSGRAQVEVIRPVGPALSRFERRRESLVAAAAQGLHAVLDVFAPGPRVILEILAGFRSDGHRPAIMANGQSESKAQGGERWQ